MSKTMFSILCLFALVSFAQSNSSSNLCSKFPENLKTVNLKGLYINGPFDSGMGFVSKNDQPITGLNHCQAEYVCNHFHGRLPTAYELAIETTPLNTFIYKSNTESEHSDGFKKIFDVTLEGNDNTFFFDTQSYTTPNSMVGRYYVWTRTLHSAQDHLAYHFNGANGHFSFIDRLHRSTQTAVRCVTP